MIDLSNIKIVLLETTHPGNIGSVARAMKTMNFSNLYLVNPLCQINEISFAMASNARDVLDNAKIYNNLENKITINNQHHYHTQTTNNKHTQKKILKS